MRSKFEKVTLIFIGLFLGLLISVNLPVFADKTKSSELPIEDLRTFAEVFGKIKTDYVEVVEDKNYVTTAHYKDMGPWMAAVIKNLSKY